SLGHEHGLQVRVAAHEAPDLLGQGETRGDVGYPGQLVAEGFLDELFARVGGAKGDDAVGVGVVHVVVGMKAWSSVSIDWRGMFGWTMHCNSASTISSSLIVSRSMRGSTSSSQRPAKPERPMVARSVPLPFTYSTRRGRPWMSRTVNLDDVLPPFQLHTLRSWPNRFDR